MPRTHSTPALPVHRQHAATARTQDQERHATAIYLADQATIRALTQRVQHLERTVRTFLGARRLTAPQRQELVNLLAGVRAPAAQEKFRWVAEQYDALLPAGQAAVDAALVACPRRPVSATATMTGGR